MFSGSFALLFALLGLVGFFGRDGGHPEPQLLRVERIATLFPDFGGLDKIAQLRGVVSTKRPIFRLSETIKILELATNRYVSSGLKVVHDVVVRQLVLRIRNFYSQRIGGNWSRAPTGKSVLDPLTPRLWLHRFALCHTRWHSSENSNHAVNEELFGGYATAVQEEHFNHQSFAHFWWNQLHQLPICASENYLRPLAEHEHFVLATDYDQLPTSEERIESADYEKSDRAEPEGWSIPAFIVGVLLFLAGNLFVHYGAERFENCGLVRRGWYEYDLLLLGFVFLFCGLALMFIVPCLI